MKHVSVIQHTSAEWLGAIEDHLEGRGVRFTYFRPFATGGTLPAAELVGDGLILLGGGPWGSAPDGRPLPTLDREVRLARACLMLGKPVVGFGLGSQILSLAADGDVTPAPLEAGIELLSRQAPNALGGLLPATFPSAVYMRDRPAPPDYAMVLASDTQGHPAIYQIGSSSFGFDANPGIRRAMVEDLIMEFDEIPADPRPCLDGLATSGVAIEDALVPIMAGLVAATGWFTPPKG